MMSTRPKVTVVGSLNLDYIASVARLPTPGQTVAATGLIQRFGGKGANQAVAAARQGAAVSMIGCVGDDDGGRAYCRRLRGEGIDIGGISATARALTGTALIAVEESAENLIIVAAGANGELRPAMLRAQRRRIEQADALVLQFEIPMPTVVEAVRVANRAGVPVMLNPSPWRDGFPWGRCRIDTLIVNDGEAQAIFDLPVRSLVSRRSAWLSGLRRRQVTRLVITRGAQSTLLLTGQDSLEVPTLKVRPVDTVGAGDAFAGTFAAALAGGSELTAAVRQANCAGALATLKAGAQEAIPTRAAVRKALRRLAANHSPR